MSSTFSTLTKSHNSGEYQTPKDFFDKLNSIFHFKVDPATTVDNPLGMDLIYTKDKDFSGLLHSWPYNTFINPPFGTGILKWINKMKSESQKHEDSVYVMLLPARVETQWFQDHIYNPILSDIYFIRGRLKFVNPELNKKKNPHIMGSMLWLLNSTQEQRDKLEDTIPGVFM